MKSRILTLSLLLGLGTLGFSTQATADDTTALRSLKTLSILLDKSSMAYQMFKLDTGNPMYSETIDKSVQRMRAIHDDYQQAAIKAKQQEDLAKINKNVDTYIKGLTSNEHKISAGGYEEYAVVAEMYANKVTAQDSIADLYTAIKSNNKVTVEPVVQETRDLATQLQTISSLYIEQSASVSGIALRAGGNKPLDQMAHEFSTKLAKFDISSDKVIGLNAKVREVKNKWAFIENSLINYKQNTVPFLVYRYADTMVDDLLDIGEMYENRNESQVKAPSIGASVSGAPPLPAGIPPANGGAPLPLGVPPAK